MAEIAPLPQGFPAPTDADTPVQKILPSGGTATFSPAALARFAAEGEWIRRMAGVNKHPAEAAAEQRQAEAAAEAKRQAEAGRPLAVLRQAHVLQAEAQAEVNRLVPLVARAHDLVEDLEGRTRKHVENIVAGERANADRLIDALAVGDQPPVLAPLADDGHLPAELRTARTALARLEAEATAAADRLARCVAGVARCACSVLANQAADLGNEILADQGRLDQRREELDALARLLTGEGRRLNGQPPALPPQVNRALYPADRQLVGTARLIASTDWGAEYAALREPEAQSG